LGLWGFFKFKNSYGNLGVYLTKNLLNDEKLKNKFELVFVWNRSFEKLKEGKTFSLLFKR
jgi:hypothetical protein